MKSFGAIVSSLAGPPRRSNRLILVRLVAALAVLVFIFSVLFHYLMYLEQRNYSWTTSVYWTLVVMSTLGFGDITFESDLGRLFSVVVLLSGTMFMLILLPFTFIQFFFVPWMEANAAARAPRQLSQDMRGHVVLTGLGPIEEALIRKLTQSHIPYVVVTSDTNEALRWHDDGYQVMVGELDDLDTYRRLGITRAAMVATTRSDTGNTNVAFTVRESCDSVPIIATAAYPASVDILELAGCNRVLQLGEILGQAMARRVLGRDAKSHVIGQFDELLIAEAAAESTPLVGRRLSEIRLREHAQVNVVGVWDRGRFQIAGPDTLIQSTTVLVLAGSREQLAAYDELFCIYKGSRRPVVIIGGGRVGRATGRALAAEGIDYRIVERSAERVRDPKTYVHGDAAELEVLKEAGIMESPSVVVTTRDDDINVYLTIYCRRLRPDIQVLSRANLERNVSTLHRAGADFVLSYSSMGANAVFNLLRHGDTLILAEGLSVFQVPVPAALAGKSLAQANLSRRTGCNVVAVIHGQSREINPDPNRPLPAEGEVIVVGDAEAERRFFTHFAPEERAVRKVPVAPVGGYLAESPPGTPRA